MYFLNDLFQPFVTGTGTERWGAMLVLVATGGVVYAIATLLTGAFRLGDISTLLRRSK